MVAVVKYYVILLCFTRDTSLVFAEVLLTVISIEIAGNTLTPLLQEQVFLGVNHVFTCCNYDDLRYVF